MRFPFSILALLTCCAVAVVAQDGATVSIEVSPDSVEAGEAFILKVRVTGGNLESLTFPDIDGLVFSRKATTTAAQLRRTPQGVSQVSEFGFMVETQKPGTFQIPSITANVDGKDIVSNAVSITVTEATTPRRRQQDTTPHGSAMAPVSPNTDGNRDRVPTLDDLMVISADVDKREVYQGEPIVLTLTLMFMTSPYEIDPTMLANSFPSLTGFYALPREPEEVVPPETRTENGFVYEVHYFKQTLFPTTSGDLEIGAWQWQGQLRLRGSRSQPLELTSEVIPIHVKPLPERPANFSGSVGEFRLEATIDKSRVIQGVPVDLVVRIVGDGNPDAVGAPKLPVMDWAYIGDVEKDLGQQSAGIGAGVDQRFIYPVTPLEAGSKTIPEIEYCFFNPANGAYETAKANSLELTVLPSAEPEHKGVTGAGDETSGVKGSSGDIDDIVAFPGELNRRGSLVLTTSLVTAMPPVAYAVLALFLRRRRRLATDTAFARSYRARARLKTALESVRSSHEPPAALFRAVVGFIADKFDVAEAGMTSIDTQKLLEQNGVSLETSAALVKILRSCERAAYASTGLSQDELSALLEGASVNLDALEAELKRRGEK
ncbi:MAG: BatD family protein [Candidatus Hydrogenedentes bacterium]|nr:BatD family protein [Candidatus Hydrogenedentota bacterium]